MMKDAGVDRFSLAMRLREMDPEQQADLNRAYDAQRAVVMRRVDEVQLCEKYLLQHGYAERLQEQLIRRLPESKDNLDALASGPTGPFVNCPELLPEIARESPIALTRTLASIALLRLGRFGESHFAAVVDGLNGEQPVAIESALAIAHWRTRLYTCSNVMPRPDWYCGFQSSKLLRAARAVSLDSPLGLWAAAALALGLSRDYAGAIAVPRDPGSREEQEAAEELRPLLWQGLSSTDRDLRFTCALALPDQAVVAEELEGPDTEKNEVARRFLAKISSPAIGSLLADGPSNLKMEILKNLSAPLPRDLVAPVLSAVEAGIPEARDKVIWLLGSNLTAPIVQRLVGLALKERDTGLFTKLLRTEDLPERREVVRTVIGAGLLPELGEEFFQDPFSIDFSDEYFLQGTCEGDPGTLDMLMTIALWQIERDAEGAALQIGRFLVRAVFGPLPMNLRRRAYELLTNYRMKPALDWTEPSIASRLLGGMDAFVGMIVSLAGDSEARGLCYSVISDVYNSWDRLIPAIGKSPERLNEFLSAVHSCAKTESFPYLAAHTQALARTAPLYPKQVFPVLFDLLANAALFQKCQEIPCYVLGLYDELCPSLSESPALTGTLVDVITGYLTPGSSIGYPQEILMDLLARILTDFPRYAGKVAERVAPLLEGSDSQPATVNQRLQSLAELCGLTAALPPDDSTPQSSPAETLDHEPLLPEQPLATLADYVAFMRDMGSSSNPMEVMARHKLSLDQYVGCINAWGELISRRDDVAMRYAILFQGIQGD